MRSVLQIIMGIFVNFHDPRWLLTIIKILSSPRSIALNAISHYARDSRLLKQHLISTDNYKSAPILLLAVCSHNNL